MFASASFVGPLPPPPPGHYRALRVESVDDPSLGGIKVATGWGDLPTPYRDGGYTMSPSEVCAAWPDTFERWFPDLNQDRLQTHGKYVVALDVPFHAAVPLGMQLCINREAARVVAVLLH